MSKGTKKFLINAAQVVGLIVVTALLWWGASALTDSELVLPDPWTVVVKAFELLGRGEIWLAFLFTLARAVVAFVLSAAVAFGLALLAGVFPKTEFCVNAVVTVLRALPTIAVILLALAVFNSAYVPVVVAFLVAFPVAYATFTRQFAHNGELFDVCKTYNVSAANKIRYFLLPLIRDELLSVAEEELPLCLKVVIAGEVLALPLKSVGREMYVGKVSLETAKVAALTLIVLAVCFVLSGVLGYFRRRADD